MRTSCKGLAAKQSGLSIVELMVSLVISMAVVAGSIQVVTSSKRSFIDQDEVTFIQTNARYAIDLLARDVRMAGFMGCASPSSVMIANSIDDNAGGFIGTQGIEGFEGEADTNDFPAFYQGAATVGTDSVIVRRASDDNALDVKTHNANSATVHLWGNHSFDKGTSLIIADASCRNIGLFQVSGPNGLPAGHLVHNTGSGTDNCTKIIKGDFVCEPGCTATKCAGATTAAGSYGPGSKIMAFVAHAYFIAESDLIPGMPALKRRALNTSGTDIEELAIGVEDLELLYGVDSDGDGSVDQYRKADQMDVDNSGTINSDDWDQALAVKISLVFRSQKEVLPAAEAKNLAGTVYNDRYIRQVVNSTVRIRNRG